MNKIQIPFGKTAAQIKQAIGSFRDRDIGYIDGYLPFESGAYAIFVRTSDGRIGCVPIDRVEGLLIEEMLG